MYKGFFVDISSQKGFDVEVRTLYPRSLVSKFKSFKVILILFLYEFKTTHSLQLITGGTLNAFITGPNIKLQSTINNNVVIITFLVSSPQQWLWHYFCYDNSRSKGGTTKGCFSPRCNPEWTTGTRPNCLVNPTTHHTPVGTVGGVFGGGADDLTHQILGLRPRLISPRGVSNFIDSVVLRQSRPSFAV